LGLKLAQPKSAHLGRNRLARFRFFYCFWDGFLSDFAFFDAKTTGNRMILPLNTSSMHASAFLVPERPIAEF
jgi:hypothetical protein